MPPTHRQNPSQTSLDADELAKFTAMASEWWDPQGRFKPLHRLNPCRIDYIRAHACRHFRHDAAKLRPLDGLRLLDIGCGGGLLSEPMARLGADVLGADAAAANIATARIHAEASNLAIRYETITAEELAAQKQQFDIVLNMEVVEHVADVPVFLAACAALVKPGGLMFFATLNRTWQAFALAIIGAEYILRWLPRGTHDWHKFITPEELAQHLQKNDMQIIHRTGVGFYPLSGQWQCQTDMSVNYMGVAGK